MIAFIMGVMPYAAEFYQYLLLRCAYATGAIAISVVPLLADYVSHKSRGTCAAILVFMSSIGALSSAFLNFTILSKLDSEHKIYIQYGVAASLIFVLGLIYTLYNLKPGNEYYTANKNQQKRTFKELVTIGK
jgi:MFS family permease